MPRSFCNEPCFLPFRRAFLARTALRRLHVFESRNAAFATEAVLRENIILRAERTARPPATVEISSSRGDLTDSIRSRLLPGTEIVQPEGAQVFIRLPASDSEHAALASLADLTGTLADLGLEVSTDQVADCSAREHLRADPDPAATRTSTPVTSRPALVEAGLLLRNPDQPDRPTNSGKTVYQLEPHALVLLQSHDTRCRETDDQRSDPFGLPLTRTVPQRRHPRGVGGDLGEGQLGGTAKAHQARGVFRAAPPALLLMPSATQPESCSRGAG